ncbi:hypothetical protein [Yersinia pseudotuberculosis]|uniref:Uncharacterized protein n=1 Tax=Yersinia pseudotuberculosis serotype O:3 (strain YPIII) TaxID=502800 RepID=A0A0H3B4Q2_YERPY|nr:hypothetical protein [Yersinia pseudotuberculosis]AJJ57902.1 hypothetical protein BZ22_3661 [Yersinia pseudotuberculosis YPIII]AJJ69829.1 hypothetical protein BZ23_704 [Yersinia pseudotuberculosis]AYW88993.1 hypothetical protein EGX87_18425 [Yersinia pseudotuberculosis]AYW99741.1 hypothetical protein EGX53_07570 [Yersinia pseudotuberculosis]AYX13013.1 hypothetical protein EGX52_20865 [Yersinia pseudotuberculosis]
MAKPAKQQPTINELGGLPPEFEADTQQEQNDNKVLSVPDVQERTAENETEGDDSTSDSDEMEVVVVKGQTLRHSGETHVENSRLFLPHDDAERLISLGVVADVKALRQQAANTIGPSITVDDGVKINRGG